MNFLGITIKSGLKIANVIKSKKLRTPVKQQQAVLKKLLKKAAETEFGKYYHFHTILNSRIKIAKSFSKNIPIHTYETMYNHWWFKARSGHSNVAWPGKVQHFALSSGTSEAASKAIPVTKDMIKFIHITSINQIISLSNFSCIKASNFEKAYLMVGGSTQLNPFEDHFEGDLSGITTGKIPFWFEKFYKPGDQISKEKDWEKKLQKIIEKAPEWDISFVAGVPAWILLIFERIIEKYHLKTIHDIWPNLISFGWGGVSIEPYKDSFSKLLDPNKPFYFIETYLASEGFIAYQHAPNESLRLITNGKIYFEFVEFNDTNFDSDGNINANAVALTLNEVSLNKNYALLISTCSGAWRYLLGDTIQFVDIDTCQIKITGRTKHFMSICGEHLSVENMNQAIKLLSNELQIQIKEYGLMAFKSEGGFGHQWFIASESNYNPIELANKLDNFLKILNDDYAVERRHALNQVKVTVFSESVFYEWMKQNKKLGGQHKFPRVLKGTTKDNWLAFLKLTQKFDSNN